MGAFIHADFSGGLSGSALEAAGAQLQSHIDIAVGRYGGKFMDREGNNCIDKYRQDSLAVVSDRIQGQRASDAEFRTRTDSFGSGEGFWGVEELEYRYTEPLMEERPALNAMSSFVVDSSVPVGARTHRVERIHLQGDATYWRGGTEAPLSQVTKDHEIFPVRHVIAAKEESFFEQQSAGFAGSSPDRFKTEAALAAIDNLLNRDYWDGNVTQNLYGVLNYPYLQVRTSAVPYNSTSTPDEILQDMHDARNWPSENSKQVFNPTAMITTNKVRNQVMQRQRSTASDMTIGQIFLRDNGSISSIETAWELEEKGPADQHGMLLYRRDRNSIALVMPQGPTMLPVQRDGFVDKTFYFASTGGVIMRNVGHNLLNWITV